MWGVDAVHAVGRVCVSSGVYSCSRSSSYSRAVRRAVADCDAVAVGTTSTIGVPTASCDGDGELYRVRGGERAEIADV
jgi:hypothetical protein